MAKTPKKKVEQNQHGLVRTIPQEIKRQIRQECGFGCVICGSSIFDYEHIDPEFKDAKEHDPRKMALLCGSCHQKVTRGVWSKLKVKEGRANPICLSDGFSSDWFDYGTELPIVTVGGATIHQPECVLQIFGHTLLEVKGAESPEGPIRINGRFYNKSGDLMFEVEDNQWKGPISNWDIETVGSRIAIRNGLGDIALVLRTDARMAFTIERLNMLFGGVRVYADEHGISFGPAEGNLYGFQGTIVNPVCCLVVLRDDGRKIDCGAEIGVPTGAQITNITICGADLAFCIRGQGLILGIGYKAIKAKGSIVTVTR